ncbi:MAG: PTS sugar transporter subunit IIB [Eubacteriales bacterium]|nr:PTS sugar transporter subunit IIB [Eubacteriales bacterium]
MKNIVWTRIDDRLIHGQVMTLWIQHASANEVVIVDDAVAKDSFIQMVMKSSMPAKISLKIFGIADAIEYLNGEDNGKRVLILVKTPGTLVALTDAGIQLDSVNVGGIGAKAGRRTLYKNISTSEAENQDLRNLIDKGIKVFFRVVVTDSEELVEKYV